MRNIEEINIVLSKANLWEPSGDGFTVTLLDRSKVQISNDELAQYDKRLPHFLTVASRRMRLPDPDDYVYGVLGSTVDTTLSYWQNEHLFLRDKHGDVYVISKIKAIRPLDDGLLVMNVEHYDTHKHRVHIDGVPVDIHYVNHMVMQILDIESDWLDASYPDWKMRWEMLELLDVHPRDRVSALLTNTQSLTSHAKDELNITSSLPNDISNHSF